jgi:hypothetical protein
MMTYARTVLTACALLCLTQSHAANVAPSPTTLIDDLWMVTLEDGGHEVVVRAVADGETLPLISLDPARRDAMVVVARQIAKETGNKFKLIRLTRRVEVMDINP